MEKGFKTNLRQGIIAIISAALSLISAILFQCVNGTFGLMRYNYYSPVIVAILGVGAVATILFTFIKMHGLASCAATVAPGIALVLFFTLGQRPAYWHIVDVFMKIDEPNGFDPCYLLFCGMLIVAFILGEIAIYKRKPGAVQE